MQIPNKYLGAVDCLIGLLFTLLAVPLIRNQVAMNGVYGIRIPKSYESEANWYAINHHGGWWLLAAGAFLVVFGIVVLIRPPKPDKTSDFIPLLYVVAPTLFSMLVLVPILLFANGLE